MSQFRFSINLVQVRELTLYVIETDAVYRNPRFRSIPSGKLPRMGLEKENLFASKIIN